MLRVKRFIRRHWRVSLRLVFLVLSLLTLIRAVQWYRDPDGNKHEPAISILEILTGLIGSFTLFDWLVSGNSGPSSAYTKGSTIIPGTVIHNTALRALSRAVEEGGTKRLFEQTDALRAVELTAHAFP